MALIQITYASAALVPFSQDDLNELLKKARVKNQSLDVSGLLLYHDGSFLQFLEGEVDAVQELYDTIEADKRHGEVKLLMRREIDERNFGDWKMGYMRVDAALDEDGFVDVLRSVSTAAVGLEGDAKSVEKVIEAFKDGRWRQKVDF